VYWPKADFEKFNAQRAAAGEPTFANPRNATAGTLKQLDSRIVAERRLRFLAHGFGQIEPLPAPTGSARGHLVVQFTLGEQLRQTGHEFAAKEVAEDIDGKEEVAWRRHPSALVQRKTTPRDDTVGVRVKKHLPGPRV
jgi:NAD-dependent DNA ligase